MNLFPAYGDICSAAFADRLICTAPTLRGPVSQQGSLYRTGRRFLPVAAAHRRNWHGKFSLENVDTRRNLANTLCRPFSSCAVLAIMCGLPLKTTSTGTELDKFAQYWKRENLACIITDWAF